MCVCVKVLSVRQQQLRERMEEKRRAREECERRRAELVQQLEEDEEEKRLQREEQEEQRTARMRDINAQVCVEKRGGVCRTVPPRAGTHTPRVLFRWTGGAGSCGRRSEDSSRRRRSLGRDLGCRRRSFTSRRRG